MGNFGSNRVREGLICRYLLVVPVFADANLRDPGLDRPTTGTAAELSQDPEI